MPAAAAGPQPPWRRCPCWSGGRERPSAATARHQAVRGKSRVLLGGGGDASLGSDVWLPGRRTWEVCVWLGPGRLCRPGELCGAVRRQEEMGLTVVRVFWLLFGCLVVERTLVMVKRVEHNDRGSRGTAKYMVLHPLPGNSRRTTKHSRALRWCITPPPPPAAQQPSSSPPLQPAYLCRHSALPRKPGPMAAPRAAKNEHFRLVGWMEGLQAARKRSAARRTAAAADHHAAFVIRPDTGPARVWCTHSRMVAGHMLPCRHLVACKEQLRISTTATAVRWHHATTPGRRPHPPASRRFRLTHTHTRTHAHHHPRVPQQTNAGTTARSGTCGRPT
jgi:hypothetical protein